MRGTRTAAAVVGAVVLATGGYVLIDGASATAGTAPERLTLVEHADTDHTTDTGPRGDSVGDVLTFHNPLFDARNRVRVGTDNGSCVRTLVGRAYECTWTNTVDGGSLVVSGPFYDDHDSTLAITGGTGRYAAAGGQMVLHARNAAGSAYDFTFTVVR